MNIIRPWAAMLALSAVGVALGGCGAAQEAPRPAPEKVVWGGSGEPEPTPEPSDAASHSARTVAAPAVAAPPQSPAAPAEPESDTSGAIDLDKPAPAKSAGAPAAGNDPAASEDSQRVLEAAKERVAEGEASDTPATSKGSKAKGSKAKASKSPKPKKGASKKRAAESKSAAKNAAEEPAESASSAPAYSGSDPCKTTRFSVPRVREACASGGRRGAKSVMKDAIQNATAAGGSLRCTSCHENQVDYKLRPDAVAQLRRWLDT